MFCIGDLLCIMSPRNRTAQEGYIRWRFLLEEDEKEA
jgi:hypothetical protein